MAAGDSVSAVLANAKQALEKAKTKFPSVPASQTPPAHEYSSAPYSLVQKARAAVNKVVGPPAQAMKESQGLAKELLAHEEMVKGVRQ